MSQERVGKNEIYIPLSDGISLISPIGASFGTVVITYQQEDLLIKEAFENSDDRKAVIIYAKKYRDSFPENTNDILLGNPKVESMDGGEIKISAERLHYFVYFGAHKRRLENPDVGEEYAALSACGVIYDTAEKCFYMSIRPATAGEHPSGVDAPGGVLNPKYFNADPFATVKDRIEKKLGLTNIEIKCIGLERVFNKTSSLYNVAMYGEVENMKPTVKEGQFSVVKLDEVIGLLKTDTLTPSAKATLLFALGQEQFTQYGWGKERVQEIMDACKN